MSTEPTERDASTDHRLRGVMAAFAALVVLVVAAAIVLPTVEAHTTDPHGMTAAGAEATVRQFVEASVVGENGAAACGYLTPDEQAAVARMGGAGAVCRLVFADAPSFRGVASAGDVRGLPLRATVSGRTARVVVAAQHGEPPAAFVLVPAPTGSAPAFGDANLAWRIASGAQQVLGGHG